MTMQKNHRMERIANSMQVAFETVLVCGREIAAARDGERVWVSVRKVCEALAISREVQQRKLNGAPWAVRTTMILTGPDGKNYENFCIDLDSLPMWLATIDVSRVGSAEAKKLLVDYQIKAASVLREHFYGRRGAVNDVAVTRAISVAVAPLAEALAVHASASQANAKASEANARAIESLTMIVAAQGRRLEALERTGAVTPANDAHCIGLDGAKRIKGALRDISTTKAGAIGQGGNAKVRTRIRFVDERALRRELAYPMDRGCAWSNLDESRFGRAMLILERMTAEADDIARLSARETGPLFRAVPTPAPTNDAAKKSGT